MIEIGNINKLKVLKETNIAYTLTDGLEEVFLHFNQSLRKLNIDEEVDAFIYIDQKKRICATLETPLITKYKYDFVKVVDICDAGVFVNIGIVKDILISKDNLPSNIRLWPRINDYLPCKLLVKKHQIVAKIIDSKDTKKEKLTINSIIEGVVTNIFEHSITVVSKNFQIISINKNLLRSKYHVGDIINCYIIEEKEDYYLGSTIPFKEKALVSDGEKILEYLNTLGGVMPLGNNSTPDEIYKILNMSKSAFKRATGNLYKQRLIEIEDYLIRLTKNKS